MIKRTYLCRHCQAEFDFDGEMHEAQCNCGSYEVQWIPRGGHIMKVSPGRHRYYDEVAKLHGLSNLHDAREGEAVAPKPPAPRLAGETYAGIPITNEGCQVITPNALPIESFTKPSPQPKMPGLRAKTHIEARWTQSNGEKKGDAA